MATNTRYPKNYYEAKLVVFSLSKELDEIRKAPRSYDRSKRLLSLIQISYTILDALNDAIEKCLNEKDLKNLNAGQAHIVKWMKRNRFPEKKFNVKK